MRTIYRVHPAIGIARLGDSPNEFFVGPEAPGLTSKPADGRFRDPQNRIRRQGARFRVYEFSYDDSNALSQVREITARDAQIEWQVHLANRKAAVAKFNSQERRNPEIPASKLIIDPGARTITGVDQNIPRISGNFMDKLVELGDLVTDEAGRLIVLGGFGKSDSEPPGLPLENYSSNDGWHDDVSDGSVRAMVRLHGSESSAAADPSWVLVAPPAYAPDLENVITLYDIVYSMQAKFVDRSLAITDSTRLSFTRDIYPLIKRPSLMHWVSEISARGHRPGRRGHFLERITQLASNAEEARAAREQIFKRLRNPYTGGGGNMPKLPDSIASEIALTVSFTEIQYEKMRLWAEGKFDDDWTGVEPEPTPFDEIAAVDQPRALDRAALEACVGSGRFPGIEAGNIMLERGTYDPERPFRINMDLLPGSLTARMAVPWQADFRDCEYEEEIGLDWWPGQRPNEIWRERDGKLVREKWVPQTQEWTADDTRRPMMVKHWSELGFIVRKKIDGEEKFVEDERLLKE